MPGVRAGVGWSRWSGWRCRPLRSLLLGVGSFSVLVLLAGSSLPAAGCCYLLTSDCWSPVGLRCALRFGCQVDSFGCAGVPVSPFHARRPPAAALLSDRSACHAVRSDRDRWHMHSFRNRSVRSGIVFAFRFICRRHFVNKSWLCNRSGSLNPISTCFSIVCCWFACDVFGCCATVLGSCF